MEILGKNKAFDIINARRKARENREAVITKDKINQGFFKTPGEPKEKKEKENGLDIPSLANTVFSMFNEMQ